MDAPTRNSARDTLMIGSQQQRWGGNASREEMYKLRKQGREAQARARNERFCATFPAPGCVRQHIPVRPPPAPYPAAGPCFLFWPLCSLDSQPLLLCQRLRKSLLRKSLFAQMVLDELSAVMRPLRAMRVCVQVDGPPGVRPSCHFEPGRYAPLL